MIEVVNTTHESVTLLAVEKSSGKNTFALSPNTTHFLKEQQIKDVHLLVDLKTFFEAEIAALNALKVELQKEGITVHSIMTPADYAWHIKYETHQLFNHASADKSQNTTLGILNNPKFSSVKALMGDMANHNAKPGTVFIALERDQKLRPNACRSNWTLEKVCTLRGSRHDNPRDYLLDQFVAHHQEAASTINYIDADLNLIPLFVEGKRIELTQQNRKCCVIC
ncbi:MAG TPA: hypothetical protein VGV92_08655 [Gammaproteobacteria bacterium]|nr:hypothetical protein [Gammaproteobacteria bacterium]